MSYVIHGTDCYVGRDYQRGHWELTRKECRAHYFPTKQEASRVLSTINSMHARTVGTKSLVISEK